MDANKRVEQCAEYIYNLLLCHDPTPEDDRDFDLLRERLELFRRQVLRDGLFPDGVPGEADDV